MVVLTATCRNGVIELTEPLPAELEGKQIQIQVKEIEPIEVETAELIGKRESVGVAEPAVEKPYRQAGSLAGQIWMAPDFDEPLEDFAEYM